MIIEVRHPGTPGTTPHLKKDSLKDFIQEWQNQWHHESKDLYLSFFQFSYHSFLYYGLAIDHSSLDYEQRLHDFTKQKEKNAVFAVRLYMTGIITFTEQHSPLQNLIIFDPDMTNSYDLESGMTILESRFEEATGCVFSIKEPVLLTAGTA